MSVVTAFFGYFFLLIEKKVTRRKKAKLTIKILVPRQRQKEKHTKSERVPRPRCENRKA